MMRFLFFLGGQNRSLAEEPTPSVMLITENPGRVLLVKIGGSAVTNKEGIEDLKVASSFCFPDRVPSKVGGGGPSHVAPETQLLRGGWILGKSGGPQHG